VVFIVFVLGLLRVLFTASGYRVGGATMAMFNLMLGLSRLGVEPILLSTRPAGRYRRFYSRLSGEGVKLLIADKELRGLKYWLWLFKEAVKQIRVNRIHLAHCHGTKEAFIVGLAARLTGRKMVYTVEGDPLTEAYYNRESFFTKFLLAALFKLGLMLADLVVGCSNWMAAWIKKQYGVDAIGIWNPIDYDRFQKLRRKPAYPTVVSVSRLDAVKDVKTLIKAADQVRRVFPDVKFLLVGDGPLRKDYEKLVEELKLGDNVIFSGFRDDVEDILSSASLVVMTSIYEPFGMAAAEAHAAGRPVVTAETGGLVEIVKNNVTGFYFKAGDWRGLGSLIVKLLRDRRLWEDMAEAAAERVKLFTPEAVARRYLKYYRKLLRKPLTLVGG